MIDVAVDETSMITVLDTRIKKGQQSKSANEVRTILHRNKSCRANPGSNHESTCCDSFDSLDSIDSLGIDKSCAWRFNSPNAGTYLKYLLHNSVPKWESSEFFSRPIMFHPCLWSIRCFNAVLYSLSYTVWTTWRDTVLFNKRRQSLYSRKQRTTGWIKTKSKKTSQEIESIIRSLHLARLCCLLYLFYHYKYFTLSISSLSYTTTS